MKLGREFWEISKVGAVAGPTEEFETETAAIQAFAERTGPGWKLCRVKEGQSTLMATK